jgi:hypothetical protein
VSCAVKLYIEKSYPPIGPVILNSLVIGSSKYKKNKNMIPIESTFHAIFIFLFINKKVNINMLEN